MGFFLEIHNGECGLGEHFCDQVWCHPETVSTIQNNPANPDNPEPRTKTKTQEEELNKEIALS